MTPGINLLISTRHSAGFEVKQSAYAVGVSGLAPIPEGSAQ